MNSKEITSEIKTSNLIILIIGGIVGLFVAYLLISNSLSDDYPQIDREKAEDGSSWAMYLLLGFSFFLIGYGIYKLIESKKTAAEKA